MGSDGVTLPAAEVDPTGLLFLDRFENDKIDTRRWLDHYLPHWTVPERSAARYDLSDDGLVLRIDADQPAWRVEDGELRVSNLQSGSWSGPVGSSRGQHRHRDDLVVTTAQPTRRMFTPTGGKIEATLRASIDPTTMLAFWLVGFEDDSAENSGEICVVELFGNAIGTQYSELSVGVKAHHDPRLQNDMTRVRVRLDATQWHTYSVDWADQQVSFFVDGQLIHQVAQKISYPMQLMLDLFEFPADGPRDPAAYPKIGSVRSVTAHRL